jgi:small subunit ribosomal protein S2
MGSELLIKREEYLSAGVHIGLVHKSKDMEKFIYKVRSNGLAVLNIATVDKRLRIAAAMIARAKRPLLVGRKEVARLPLEQFSKYTGAKVITGRFMPGSLTNATYEHFFEPDVIVITDSMVDRQALREAIKTRVPIIAFADTVHSTAYIDLVIPANIKARKSLGLLYWTLAKEVMRLKGEKFTGKLKDFVGKDVEEVDEKEEDDVQKKLDESLAKS